MIEQGTYRVLMDEKWGLLDLYEFPHAFAQTYSFIYCFDSTLEPRDAVRIETALNEYPWRGGYSYVNIYTVLWHQIPPDKRPIVSSIHFASPGWMDLLLNPDVALQVAKSVGILMGTAFTAAQTYKKIYKTLADIKEDRAQRSLQATRREQQQIRILMQMCNDLSKHLGFKNVAHLHKQTNDPEISSKLLLAHYRRLKKLSNFVEKGKAILPEKMKDD